MHRRGLSSLLHCFAGTQNAQHGPSKGTGQDEATRLRGTVLPSVACIAIAHQFVARVEAPDGGAPAAWPACRGVRDMGVNAETSEGGFSFGAAVRPARVRSMPLTVPPPVLRRPRPGPPERGAAVCRVEGPHRHEDGDHHRGSRVQGESAVSGQPHGRGSDAQPPRVRRRTGWSWVQTLGAPTGTQWLTRTARRSTT
jgi:hypothetical protein